MLVKLAKSWRRLQKVAYDIPRLTKDRRELLAKQIAKEYLEIVLQHLKEQDLPWVPLVPEYKKWKQEQGLSTKIWIATGELSSYIKIIETPDGDYFIGIDPSVEHGGSGLLAAELALIHEYGRLDKSIPARPLFRASYWELQRKMIQIAAKVDKQLVQKYYRDLSRYGVK